MVMGLTNHPPPQAGRSDDGLRGSAPPRVGRLRNLVFASVEKWRGAVAYLGEEVAYGLRCLLRYGAASQG